MYSAVVVQEVLQRRLEPWSWRVQWLSIRSWQWQLWAIIEADPLTTTWEVAKEFDINHSVVIQHLKQIVVQSLSCVWLFMTTWTAACQASLSFTNSQSLLKLMSIESVMLPNHFILCCPLLLLPSVFPSIRVFSNVSFRWPKF